MNVLISENGEIYNQSQINKIETTVDGMFLKIYVYSNISKDLILRIHEERFSSKELIEISNSILFEEIQENHIDMSYISNLIRNEIESLL